MCGEAHYPGFASNAYQGIRKNHQAWPLTHIKHAFASYWNPLWSKPILWVVFKKLVLVQHCRLAELQLGCWGVWPSHLFQTLRLKITAHGRPCALRHSDNCSR